MDNENTLVLCLDKESHAMFCKYTTELNMLKFKKFFHLIEDSDFLTELSYEYKISTKSVTFYDIEKDKNFIEQISFLINTGETILWDDIVYGLDNIYIVNNLNNSKQGYISLLDECDKQYFLNQFDDEIELIKVSDIEDIENFTFNVSTNFQIEIEDIL